jgi:hypothetical protein
MIYGIIGFLLGFLVGGYVLGSIVLWTIRHMVWQYWAAQGLNYEAIERNTAEVLDQSRIRYAPPVWRWEAIRRETREQHHAAVAAKAAKEREESLRRQAVEELKAEMRENGDVS